MCVKQSLQGEEWATSLQKNDGIASFKLCMAEGEAFSLNPWENKRSDVNTQFSFLPILGDDTPPRLWDMEEFSGRREKKLHSEATATPAILNLCVGVFSFTANSHFHSQHYGTLHPLRSGSMRFVRRENSSHNNTENATKLYVFSSSGSFRTSCVILSTISADSLSSCGTKWWYRQEKELWLTCTIIKETAFLALFNIFHSLCSFHTNSQSPFEWIREQLQTLFHSARVDFCF